MPEENIAKAVHSLDQYAAWLQKTVNGLSGTDLAAFKEAWGKIREKWDGLAREMEQGVFAG